MGNVILDLCGGSGAWSEPYKKAGYDVRVITLPTYNVQKVTFSDNSIEFERMDVHWHETLSILIKDIHGILAAPPCTEFSLAKGGQKRNFEEAMKVVSACMNIIWHCRSKEKIQFWALENPKGFLRQFLGKPAYFFEQWEFGDDGIKPTDIWGYFNPPKKLRSDKPHDLTVKFPNGRTNGRGMSIPKVPEKYKGLGLNRAALRAITPFANAFFEANS